MIAISLLAAACRPGAGGASDGPAWRQGLAAWRQQRAESIAGPDGWITLVGRLWLSPGPNRFGSGEACELRLPQDRAPALAGTITLDGGRLHVKIAPGVPVLVDGAPIDERELADDREGKPTVLSLGSLSMRVIKRQDRYALRVKDREHPARKTFAGLAYYPIEARLRVRARLEPAPQGKTLPIVNVLGQIEPTPMAGTLRFTLDGAEHTLDALLEGDELFVLFKDETSGHGSYPSGRFLYAPRPGPDGVVDLDFNRAFTPPCGFTDFATCPLPPKQNALPLAIAAGERYDHAH